VTEDRLLKTVDQPLPVAIIADNLWALTRKYDFFNTAGDIDKPDLQLAKMSPAERNFCLKKLWQIDSSSTERDVLAILGAPSRSLKYKKNWWVSLDGRRDRAGVLFDSSGFAVEVILDGGPGLYYRRDVKDHEAKPAGG
jgi:hypothetical protein